MSFNKRKIKVKKRMLCFVLFSMTIGVTIAQTTEIKEVEFGQLTPLPRQDTAMQKWRSNRFGQFIHWGLYSVPGGFWKGKSYKGAAEWLPKWAKISSSEWEELKNDFNPTKYNPTEWAKMAKRMGVRYATITTKHHDGFCLWTSKYTDFDIEATPYKGDLIGEFINAYNKKGIDVYLYYSVLDWKHPDWRYEIKTAEDKEAFERFKTFTENQLVELLTKYPSVKGFWFDGTWDKSWKDNGKFSYELEKRLKKISPGLIVNSRMRADEYGSRHFDSNGVLMGDYESGYERRLPDPTDVSVTKNDWESCMTIPENQWGYHKDWSIGHLKSSYELIQMLVHATSQNGNFLLNFGPKSDGTFRKEEIAIMEEIGDWMKINGEAIYSNGYAELKKQDWGFYTKNKETGKTHMIVFNTPFNNKYRVNLNKGSILKRAYFLSTPNKEIEVKEVQKNQYYVMPSKKNDSNIPLIIVLDIKTAESKKFFQKAKM
ncbi:MAG: alpha-L-fucosidase [Cellulophaga sp.]